jgi:hypothetical protein
VLLELAQNVLAAGLVAICSADFLYTVERERAQSLIAANGFIDLDASSSDKPNEVAEQIGRTLAQRGIRPS